MRSAGVVKLVDAEDSKSSAFRGHVGSSPTSGTKNRVLIKKGGVR